MKRANGLKRSTPTKRTEITFTLCEIEILLLSIDRYDAANRGDYFRQAKAKLLKASRELKQLE